MRSSAAREPSSDPSVDCAGSDRAPKHAERRRQVTKSSPRPPGHRCTSGIHSRDGTTSNVRHDHDRGQEPTLRRRRARHAEPEQLGARRGPAHPLGVRAGARVARRRPAPGRATACSSAARRSRRAAASGSRRSTRPPRSRSPRSRAPASRTSTRPSPPRAARSAATWGQLPGRERAKYLFRIARILQERSREFAVLETLDGGKPIKESRDVDVPLAAAHFWYYAGWADKLEYAFPGRATRDRSASPRRSSPGTSRC